MNQNQNQNQGKKKDRNALEIDYNLQPYHRKWSNNGFHFHSSRIGGAFGWTKRTWTDMLEDYNRKQKALKKKLKSK